MDDLEIRKSVRDAYSGRVSSSCCDSSQEASSTAEEGQSDCCGTGDQGRPAKLGLYDPVKVARLQPGETVVDLGSGTGIDVFKASSVVGKDGKVIGVDATPEMIFKARQTAQDQQMSNVEFRLGEIEHLPIETGSVDAIISDCVINLSPDKEQVFRDAFRVLRPGGRIIVSDVVSDTQLPESVRKNAALWAACVAGAVTKDEYLDMLKDAGFEGIKIEKDGGKFQQNISSMIVSARKPQE